MARKQAIDQEVTEIEEQLSSMSRQYEKLKTLLNQKQQARSRRQHTKTTIEMIADRSSSVRFRRREETKNVLEYIHGGEEAAVLGAWDFFVTCGGQELLDSLISKYKRGKYLQ